MTDYLYVILQIVLPPCIISIIALYIIVAWYKGADVLIGYGLRIYDQYKERQDTWHEKNSISQTT